MSQMDHTWFTTQEVGSGVWALVDPIGQVAPDYDVPTVNIYLVVGSERAAVIDSGLGLGDLLAACRALTDRPLLTLCSHSHWDHIGGAYLFDDRRIHALEAERLTTAYDVEGVTHIHAAPATAMLAEGDMIDLGGRTLTIWHTPGHSPGHVSILDSATGFLFCADTCYAGTMWMQTNDANLADWRTTLERIGASNAITSLCVGHGAPKQPPTLTRRILTALDQALAGKSTSQPFDFDPGARKHQFDGFSILLPESVTSQAAGD
ncbi:MAG TPA: MBL fold metallo-hydrolase [Ktedonobacterales bacterium]|nr:MBL fold metallo-hydrolase [Ktedonobacterales bacterium]